MKHQNGDAHENDQSIYLYEEIARDKLLLWNFKKGAQYFDLVIFPDGNHNIFPLSQTEEEGFCYRVRVYAWMEYNNCVV